MYFELKNHTFIYTASIDVYFAKSFVKWALMFCSVIYEERVTKGFVSLGQCNNVIDLLRWKFDLEMLPRSRKSFKILCDKEPGYFIVGIKA